MVTVIILLIILCGVICLFLMNKKNKQANTFVAHVTSEHSKNTQDQKSYWMLLHVLLAQFCELQENTIYLKNIQTQLDEINKLIAELKEIYDPDIHSKMVKKAVKEYVESGNDKPERDIVLLLEQPFNFDTEKVRYAKYTDIVNNFAPYWDEVVGKLKQKAAISKRRQYLIEQSTEMIAECDKYGYDDLIDILNIYRKKQEELLNTMS